ncbi:hypothetical protein C8Q80DRAFT_767425 [Daedaleopsis nitida]|nr:hypothetical protein C8Q80DRAFT_767425 [Daedaleopsis nitida]
MLLALPSDISLHIFAYLSLLDLLHVRLTSRAVHAFFLANEESIFHRAAIFHQFVRAQTTLEGALRDEHYAFRGVHDWKELCRRRVLVERNWDGHGCVHEGGYPPGEDTVMSFTIDETQQISIAFARKTGVSVHSLEDGRLLWGLSKEYVGTSRLDFSNGFLVFMAKHSGLEIWRRASDLDPTVPPLLSRGRAVTTPLMFPSVAAVRDFQVQAASLAPVMKLSTRGHFDPHAYVDTSNVGVVRLFRLNYPLLAYLGFNYPNQVTVVDIATGEILWTVSIGHGRVRGMSPTYSLPGDIYRVSMDIDLSKEHLCICMYSVIVVFRLPKHWTSDVSGELGREVEQDPTDMLVLGDIDSPAARQSNAFTLTPAMVGRTEHSIEASVKFPYPVVASPVGADAFERYHVTPPSEAARKANMQALVPMGGLQSQPGFVCARFSPDGKHIVAATAFGLLYLAWDFARVENGMLFSDLTEYLFFDEPLRDVSWDAQDRRSSQRARCGTRPFGGADHRTRRVRCAPPRLLESRVPGLGAGARSAVHRDADDGDHAVACVGRRTAGAHGGEERVAREGMVCRE